MNRKKTGKSLLSLGMLILALWIAIPKVYIHALFQHNHEFVKTSSETRVQSEQSQEDCDFDQYNKPVYFHIFTFISKIIPVKPGQSGGSRETQLHLPNISVLISLLRAPPVAN